MTYTYLYTNESIKHVEYIICIFQAVRFLHECGVLLHYPDVKSKLSKLFFLEPEWLCSLLAQIITVAEVNPLIDKQGVSTALLNLHNSLCH